MYHCIRHAALLGVLGATLEQVYGHESARYFTPPPRKEVHEAALQWFARTKTLMPAIKTVSRRTARPSVVWPWHNKVCALRIEA